jgi:hypothetical protein
MWFKSVNSDSSALLYGVFSFLEWSQHFNNNLVKTLPLISLDHILLVLTTLDCTHILTLGLKRYGYNMKVLLNYLFYGGLHKIFY